MKRVRNIHVPKNITEWLLLLALIIFSFSSLQAQLIRKVVKPVDITTRNTVGIAGTKEGLYHAYLDKRKDSRAGLILSFFNGFYSKIIATIDLDSGANVKGIKLAPNGEIIIYGSFEYQLPLDATIYKNLLTYSKGTWTANKKWTGFREKSIINAIDWDTDTMILGGYFDSIGTAVFNHVAKYINDEFLPVIDTDSDTGVNNTIIALAVRNHILYISGLFNTTMATTSGGFAYLEDQKWIAISKPFGKGGLFTFLGRDVIIHNLSDPNQFYRINISNNTVTGFSTGIENINRLQGLTSFNNQIYAVGNFTMSLGSLNSGWISFQNSFWQTVNGAKDCNFIDSAAENLYIVGRSLLGFLSQSNNQYIGVHHKDDKLIYGSLFLDLNNNCNIDTTDFPVPKRSIRFGTDNRTVITNEKGIFHYYYRKIENKMPTLLMDKRAFDYQLCVKDSNSLKNITTDLLGPISVAVRPIGIKKARLDTRVIVHGGQRILKSGRNVVSYLITNVGLEEASNIKVTLRGTHKMKNLVSFPPHTFVDTSITWSIPNIRPLGFYVITIAYALQDNSNIVDNELEFSIKHEYFNAVEDDSGLDQFSQTVTDEDFIALKEQGLPELPKGISANIAATDTVIEYQITFQNRTSQVVRDVVVIDTIDLRYNLLYTQTIASSHEFTNTIAQDPVDPNIGYLIYTFSDINLKANPDGNPEVTDDEGYIKFKFVFNQQHQLNDEIKNTATVIMNDNYYYPTNTVVCNVDKLVTAKTVTKELTGIVIYPNPASKSLNVILPNDINTFSYTIVDTKGATVLSTTQTDKKEIDIDHLNTGMYLLQITSGNQMVVLKFLKE